jgi:hypothetical protein
VPLGGEGISAAPTSAGVPQPLRIQVDFSGSGAAAQLGCKCFYDTFDLPQVSPSVSPISFTLNVFGPGSQSYICQVAAGLPPVPGTPAAACTHLQAGTAAALYDDFYRVSCPNGYNADLEEGSGNQIFESASQSLNSAVTTLLQQVCDRFAS